MSLQTDLPKTLVLGKNFTVEIDESMKFFTDLEQGRLNRQERYKFNRINVQNLHRIMVAIIRSELNNMNEKEINDALSQKAVDFRFQRSDFVSIFIAMADLLNLPYFQSDGIKITPLRAIGRGERRPVLLESEQYTIFSTSVYVLYDIIKHNYDIMFRNEKGLTVETTNASFLGTRQMPDNHDDSETPRRLHLRNGTELEIKSMDFFNDLELGAFDKKRNKLDKSTVLGVHRLINNLASPEKTEDGINIALRDKKITFSKFDIIMIFIIVMELQHPENFQSSDVKIIPLSGSRDRKKYAIEAGSALIYSSTIYILYENIKKKYSDAFGVSSQTKETSSPNSFGESAQARRTSPNPLGIAGLSQRGATGSNPSRIITGPATLDIQQTRTSKRAISPDPPRIITGPATLDIQQTRTTRRTISPDPPRIITGPGTLDIQQTRGFVANASSILTTVNEKSSVLPLGNGAKYKYTGSSKYTDEKTLMEIQKEWKPSQLQSHTLREIRSLSNIPTSIVPHNRALSKLQYYIIKGIDALKIQDLPSAIMKNPVIQVASQFNFLESQTPEYSEPIEYFNDYTQGPRSSLAFPMALLDRDHTFKSYVRNASKFGMLSKYYKGGYFTPESISIKDYFSCQRSLDDMEILIQDGYTLSSVHATQVFCAAPSFQNKQVPQDSTLSAMLCDLYVVAQYEAIARVAVWKGILNGPVDLHLTLVGQGVFNNPRSTILKALLKCFQILEGTNVRAFIHVYDDRSFNNLPDPIKELPVCDINNPPVF